MNNCVVFFGRGFTDLGGPGCGALVLLVGEIVAFGACVWATGVVSMETDGRADGSGAATSDLRRLVGASSSEDASCIRLEDVCTLLVLKEEAAFEITAMFADDVARTDVAVGSDGRAAGGGRTGMVLLVNVVRSTWQNSA